jgi:DNA-binding NarL/FixJ family response regulator
VVLKDEAGSNFRDGSTSGFDTRNDVVRETAHILIVDPVLGSRFALAQAVSQLGSIVHTASDAEEARDYLDRDAVSLVIADHDLGDRDGLDFLIDVRNDHSETCRALVTAEEDIDFVRCAIERAGLSFLLSKPWNPSSLCSTIREILGGRQDYANWTQIPSSYVSETPGVARSAPRSEGDRLHELLLRGLLAGLNSCEREVEVFELVHSELALPFRIDRWLWVDEESGLGTRIAGDWPVERDVEPISFSQQEVHLLSQARRSLRVTRLDNSFSEVSSGALRRVCLSLAIRDGGHRTMTALIWLDRARSGPFVEMLRQLQVGMQMAFRRIRTAEARAARVRCLAERVAKELRTPVGALTHAIDRLRGEAEQAGLPSEWVERVFSESERVVRAVEHLEGEMLSEPSRMVRASS